MRGISKRYPGARALDNASLDVRAGEVHVVLGENGAGKSTLMKILSGAVRADAGEILLDGAPVELSSPLRARRLGISTIYQELSLVPHLSVAENIFLGKTPTRWAGVVDLGRMRAGARRILDGLGVAIDCDAPVHSLRLAQQQMVEVARALSDDARLLVMDEPTSALSQREVGELFADDRAPDIERRGGRLHLPPDGRGVPHRPSRDGAARRLPRGDAQHRRRDRRRSSSGSWPIAKWPNTIHAGEHATGEELLRVDRLHGGGLEDISFVLHRGEILGIAGLVGAGRTPAGARPGGRRPGRRAADRHAREADRHRFADGCGACRDRVPARRIASSRGWCCGCPSSGTSRSRTSARLRGSASLDRRRSAAKPRTPSPACASGHPGPISWC